MDYNRQKHIQLMHDEAKLNQNNKSLLIENPKKFLYLIDQTHKSNIQFQSKCVEHLLDWNYELGYNHQKHIQLMQDEAELNQNNTSLFSENLEKFLYLVYYTNLLDLQLKSKYICRVDDQRHWNYKNQYSQLIESFLDGKVDGKIFASQFLSMAYEIQENWPPNYNSLSSILLNPESLDFKKWIIEIGLCSAKFTYPADELGIGKLDLIKTENQLRAVVKDLFSNIQ